MPTFLLNRTHVLSGHGHMINFIKGEPTYVPSILANAAIAIGAECTDEVIDPLGPEKVVEPELTAEERETLLMAAFEQLEARSGTHEDYRHDYSGQGLPNIKALAAIVGFTPEAKERTNLFQKYREAKAQ